MAESDRERAYLMAQGAWRRFGHSSEPEEAFARRIADIAAAQGLSAAAEAIAQDCRDHGLEMSAQRVLKGLSNDLSHGGQPGPQPMPPGVRAMLDDNSRKSGGDPGCFIVLIIGIVLIIAWFWFF